MSSRRSLTTSGSNPKTSAVSADSANVKSTTRASSAHVLHAGKTERDDVGHRAHDGVADEQAECASRGRQQQALHEQHLQ